MFGELRTLTWEFGPDHNVIELRVEEYTMDGLDDLEDLESASMDQIFKGVDYGLIVRVARVLDHVNACPRRLVAAGWEQ